MKKKTITELRRALRIHALSVADLLKSQEKSSTTECRVHEALMAVSKEIGGPPYEGAFAGSAESIRCADGEVWSGVHHSRDELKRLAGVLALPLPKKLTR